MIARILVAALAFVASSQLLQVQAVTFPTNPVNISSAGNANQVYNLTALSGATGGLAPYTWNTTSTLPANTGLTLSSSGVLSGTTKSTGYTGAYNVSVYDSESTVSYLIVNFAINAVPTSNITFTNNFTSLVLEDGQSVNASLYDLLLPVGGDGLGNYSWSISPELSNGLSFEDNTYGNASGTVSYDGTSPQTGSHTITCSDSQNSSLFATTTFTATFYSALAVKNNKVVSFINGTNITSAQANALSTALDVTGGAAPYTYSVLAGGNLTSCGVAVDSTTLALSGTASANPAYCNGSISVSDNADVVREVVVAIQVISQPSTPVSVGANGTTITLKSGIYVAATKADIADDLEITGGSGNYYFSLPTSFSTFTNMTLQSDNSSYAGTIKSYNQTMTATFPFTVYDVAGTYPGSSALVYITVTVTNSAFAVASFSVYIMAALMALVAFSQL